MEIEANEGTAPSVFSRPPQPRPGPSPFAVARPHGAPASVVGPSMTAEERAALEGQRRRGGQWFYWVAGLSLINSVLALTGQKWHFILGLGVTQLFQELGQQSGGALAGAVGLAVIGFFAVLGHRAIDGARWAFVVGMVLFALDGVIFLLVQDWLGVGFHAFALTMILRGYLAARRLPAA
jgi:hypothetical protein